MFCKYNIYQYNPKGNLQYEYEPNYNLNEVRCNCIVLFPTPKMRWPILLSDKEIMNIIDENIITDKQKNDGIPPDQVQRLMKFNGKYINKEIK